MNVLIIDYGMGNLRSVLRAFEECGANVVISSDPSQLRTADRIVLPGVGAFADGMERLNIGNWPAELKIALQNPQVHLLGICLGMQLLADHGEEGGDSAGLGLIPGRVMKFRSDFHERIPHMGWNEVSPIRPHPLFDSIPSGTDFYFVHSYHFSPADSDNRIANTPYCGEFTSVVAKGNVCGVQFHPEKSSKPGFQLIRNFLKR